MSKDLRVRQLCVSTLPRPIHRKPSGSSQVRLCRLYAEVMQTQLWRPNVGITELGEDNLFHLGADGLEPITMVLVEIRRGRSLDTVANWVGASSTLRAAGARQSSPACCSASPNPPAARSGTRASDLRKLRGATRGSLSSAQCRITLRHGSHSHWREFARSFRLPIRADRLGHREVAPGTDPPRGGTESP